MSPSYITDRRLVNANHFDDGMTDDSPDWMYGLGISFRF